MELFDDDVDEKNNREDDLERFQQQVGRKHNTTFLFLLSAGGRILFVRHDEHDGPVEPGIPD